MTKYLKLIFILIFLFNSSYSRDLCDESELVIGFFNGVGNKKKDARKSLKKLEERITASNIDIDHTKVKYKLFYNTTHGKLNDILETYRQINHELNTLKTSTGDFRYELMYGNTNFDLNYLINMLPTQSFISDGVISQFAKLDALLNKTLAEARAKSTEKEDYKIHRRQIDNLLKESLKGIKFLFVAHSQGNLFVNQAFDYVKTLKGYQNKEAVKVVHIAPASIKLNGEYVLVDIDIIINLFREVLPGKAFEPTEHLKTILPKEVVYALSKLKEPHAKFALLGLYLFENSVNLVARQKLEPLNLTDLTGHEFVNTYLNPNFGVLKSVLSKIDNAIKSLEVPELKEEEKVKEGFFSAMLKWDSPWDIDLRVIEPDGNLIDAWNKKGSSGELDIDDRVGTGPEYYHASCDSDKLQTGIYRIVVVRYVYIEKCKGKHQVVGGSCKLIKADLYIGSVDNDNLISQSISLGHDNQLNLGFNMIDLEVSKDIYTNKYSVKVIDHKPKPITDWRIRQKP